MTEPILVAEGLRKAFQERVAVDDVSFLIGEGESYGLLGPNGAGKTTTISMVAGLLHRDAGEVTVAGLPMNEKATKAKEAIGYVPQEIALYPDLTGRENLNFFGRLYGLRRPELGRKVDGALEIVGLVDRATDRVSSYSGGMQRRLNIAAGLLHNPKLLILDEPTVGVDPQSRNAILENVETLKSQGLAVLYTTHYMEEAERLCDRIGIIDEGKLIAEGTRRELVASIKRNDRVEIATSSKHEEFIEEALRIDGVEDASRSDQGVQLLCEQGRSLLPRLLDIADKVGAEVASVEVFEPDLEAVFLHLTGKALRD